MILGYLSRYAMTAIDLRELAISLGCSGVASTFNDCQLDRARWKVLAQVWPVVDDILWIDDDVWPSRRDVDRLIMTPGDIVCGVYPIRGAGEPAVGPSGKPAAGGLLDLRWCHFGLTITRVTAWQKLVSAGCPECKGVPAPWWPIIDYPEDDDYHGDDIAFCLRAKAAGCSIVANLGAHAPHGWPSREWCSDAAIDALHRGERLATGGRLDASKSTDWRVDAFARYDGKPCGARPSASMADGRWETARVPAPTHYDPSRSSPA